VWQVKNEQPKESHQPKSPADDKTTEKVFISFKDVKEPNWESALRKIKRLIKTEFLRHKYLREAKGFEAEEREYYAAL